MARITQLEKAARRRRTRRRRTAIRGALAALTFLPMAERLPVLAGVLVGLLRDPRVPASRKALLAGALGYVLAPVELVPDRIPVLGWFDDLVVAALAIDTFVAGIPEDVLEERLAAAGLARAVFDEDVSRIRRTIPLPVRRLVAQVPGALEAAARTVRAAGIDTRVKGMFAKEGSPA